MSHLKQITIMAKIFKAFADPTRLRLIGLLASNMEEKLCVVDLAKKLDISQPAASQHIKVLKNINILYAKNERPRIYYYINIIEFKKQKAMLDQLYEQAFIKCAQSGQCEKCPFRDECDDVK